MPKLKLLLLSLTLTLTIFSQAFAQTPNDLNPSSPYYLPAIDLLNNQILKLDRNNNFNPTTPITRGQFLKMAFDYQNFIPQTGLRNITWFNDISNDSPLAPYVLKALELDILLKTPEFKPDEPIKREEAIKYTIKIFGLSTPLTKPTQNDLFNDIRPTNPNAYIYSALKKHNITFSSTPNNLLPHQILTKADATELLFKTKATTSNSTQPQRTNFPLPAQVSIDPTINEIISTERFQGFVDAWKKINQTQKIDKNKLIEGAIEGLVKQLNDPYTSYFNQDQSTQYLNSLSGEMEGIGVYINKNNQNQFFISNLIENAPAQKAGLLIKDIITKINNTSVENLNENQIYNLMKGKAGTSINLEIIRGNQTLNFNITREKIILSSISSSIINNNIGYISILEFTQNSGILFIEHFTKLRDQKISRFIIDLRENNGGYTNQTAIALSQLIPKNKILYYYKPTNPNQQTETQTSYGPGLNPNEQIIILINQNTASSAEIFAAAIQEHNIGKLVGKQTFGKGLIQELSSLGQSGTLKITIGEWLTPNQNPINSIGVKPDYTIDLDPIQYKKNIDTQLSKAIELLS